MRRARTAGTQREVDRSGVMWPSGGTGEGEQPQRVVVGRAWLGLEDAEAQPVVQAQHLEAEGEVPDLRMVERLYLAAPVPEVVASPQAGELGAAGRDLDHQGGQVGGVRG